VRNWLVTQYIWRYRRGVVITGLDCSYTDVSKALRSSIISVLICQLTRRSITSHFNVQQHCCKNPKSQFKTVRLLAPLLLHDGSHKAHINTQHSILSAFSYFLTVWHSTAFTPISLRWTLNSCLPEAQDNSIINSDLQPRRDVRHPSSHSSTAIS
jgi:hypothetical protein